MNYRVCSSIQLRKSCTRAQCFLMKTQKPTRTGSKPEAGSERMHARADLVTDGNGATEDSIKQFLDFVNLIEGENEYWKGCGIRYPYKVR